ncbi:filamentous hemagglutinin outer membrane protein [Nitritalea halalkaliphila LW7]|uniref:Filamentous hemagglutinin outer membrane protein n=1 Tax=Nitritalea halalkaliphila LW7 TaxID=1189621 RepID=I5C9T4_9BACT|nr:filamentous hemagglutinin outer membrane protein [Nitritalea halalkaliphila LW7]
MRIAPRLEEGQRFVLLSLDEGITAVNPENPEELLLLGAGQALAEVQVFEGERLLRTLPISFRIAPATLSIIVEEGQFKFEGEADPVFTFFAEGFIAPDTEAILSGALERAPGEAPGRYLISQGSLTAGPNYAIAFTAAEFEIREVEEVVEPAPDPIEKIRDFIAGTGDAPTQADYAALDHVLNADQVVILNAYLLIVGSPSISEAELAEFVAELLAFRDTDGDEVPDIVEIIQGTDPLDPADYLDSDGDLVPDFVENLQGTDPKDAQDFLDTNGDGVPDYVRVRSVLTLMDLEPYSWIGVAPSMQASSLRRSWPPLVMAVYFLLRCAGRCKPSILFSRAAPYFQVIWNCRAGSLMPMHWWPLRRSSFWQSLLLVV